MKSLSSNIILFLLFLFPRVSTTAFPDLSHSHSIHKSRTTGTKLQNSAVPPATNKAHIFRPHDRKRTIIMSPNNERFQGTIELLRGSEGYAVASTASFLISLGVLYWAIVRVDMTREQRVIATLTVFYLISSTFTLAKTIRDWQMSKIIHLPILAGTTAWFWQCVISFVLALVACVYAALVVEAPEIVVHFGNKSITESKEPIGFLLIGLSFALSSTLSLAKLVRDRQDSQYFENCGTATPEQVATLIRDSHGVYGNAIWALFFFDAVAFLYSLWRFHLTRERVDLLVLGSTFLVYACFVLSKAVRDNNSPTRFFIRH